jgi:hypothetical protein
MLVMTNDKISAAILANYSYAILMKVLRKFGQLNKADPVEDFTVAPEQRDEMAKSLGEYDFIITLDHGKEFMTSAASASCGASRVASERGKYAEKHLAEFQMNPEQYSRRMKLEVFKSFSQESICTYLLREKACCGSLHIQLRHKPKQADFTRVTDQHLQKVRERPNNHPIKCLGWRIQNEVISSQAADVGLLR